jgi:aryl sulfotransferase
MKVRNPVRRYRHAVFDSGRWDGFEPRSSDIVIATSMKAGTTWMQGIVASLLWPDGHAPGYLGELSPWLEMRLRPVEEVLARLDAQDHRRFIKTHTAADGVPIYDGIHYVVVGRDGRDVFMSTINHWDKMRHGLIRMLNELAGDDVPELPVWHGDVHAFFDSFVSKGSFPWEGDGAPWWSHFNHCATWWELRDEPNVLFVHYNDLLADLEGEMRRVAEFCRIEVPENAWPAVVQRCHIDEMRKTPGRPSDTTSTSWAAPTLSSTRAPTTAGATYSPAKSSCGTNGASPRSSRRRRQRGSSTGDSVLQRRRPIMRDDSCRRSRLYQTSTAHRASAPDRRIRRRRTARP